MKRRGFLRRVLGTAAVAVIAPEILKQIEEYEYVVEGKPRPKKKPKASSVENVFTEGEGFWVTYEGIILAWSRLQAMTLSMNTPAFEITSMDSPGGMREFIPGKMEATFEISNLNIVDIELFQNVFQNDHAMVGLIATVDGGTTFSGEGMCISLSAMGTMNEPTTYDATFRVSGALIRNDE